jgi:hypothetical protein
MIISGIPYLTLADEERLRALIEEKQKAASTAASTPTSNHIPNIPTEQKSFMESILYCHIHLHKFDGNLTRGFVLVQKFRFFLKEKKSS